jgi:hypothetical protein
LLEDVRGGGSCPVEELNKTSAELEPFKGILDSYHPEDSGNSCTITDSDAEPEQALMMEDEDESDGMRDNASEQENHPRKKRKLQTEESEGDD